MKRIIAWLKKYFIPHGENNYKPHFLRHESTLFVFLAVILVELAFLVQVFIVFDKTNFLASVLPGVLTSLTNKERAQNNAFPVVQNDLLTKAAELKAQDMATRGYFAHTSPDGKTPWYWLEQVGYRYSMAGENLAVNFFESDDVAKAWMNSPTHRENIVKKNYTEIGIGVASGIYKGSKTVFVAQFFGTPIALASPNITTPLIKEIKNTNNPAAAQLKPLPTKVQVLGEETNSVVATSENRVKLSNIKSFIQKVLVSPREYVTYVYAGILLLIILALLLAIFIKSEIKHPLIIARGITLMAIILFLLFVNIKVLHLETEVPNQGLAASVIASH